MKTKPIHDRLTTSIRYLKGVGPERAKTFRKLGIETIEDLLYYLPRKHYDRTQIKKIAELATDEAGASAGEIVIQGIVERIVEYNPRRRKLSILNVSIADETGSLTAVWFNQPFLKFTFRVGDDLIVSGRIKYFNGTPQIHPEEYEIIPHEEYTPIHAKRIVPLYPETKNLSRRQLRRFIWNVLTQESFLVPEFLPPEIRNSRQLMELTMALRHIHFPESAEDFHAARRRLVYEELFLMQVYLALRRYSIQESKVKVRLKLDHTLDFRIRRLFPFKLTRAQERVINEIRRDLTQDRPMNRLLQGDVGSGKTVVAIYALLAAVGNHTQTAFMAPTELLAEQHFQTLSRTLAHSKVRLCLLRSGIPGTQKKALLRAIQSGEIDLVVGTHALIQENVAFKNLTVAVIDEQHKFGVHQRAALRQKGEAPHTLVMTATPIPRTLSLTLFGDLDVSVIDELPPGRKAVRTLLRPAEKITESFTFIRQKLREGQQAYFVYPLIDESDKLPLKSATRMVHLLKDAFRESRVELIHGEMKKAEQEAIMQAFREGKIHILVSTLVIEVGIDVPRATLMVIEHAERYGLAQLHQLRGRIGRSEEQSYCLLFANVETLEEKVRGIAKKRLDALTQTNDGFKIAEEDLRLRGPGEFFGIRQSGLPELKIANLVQDIELLRQARRDAFAYVARNPTLSGGHGTCLKETLRRRFKGQLELIAVG